MTTCTNKLTYAAEEATGTLHCLRPEGHDEAHVFQNAGGKLYAENPPEEYAPEGYGPPLQTVEVSIPEGSATTGTYVPSTADGTWIEPNPWSTPYPWPQPYPTIPGYPGSGSDVKVHLEWGTGERAVKVRVYLDNGLVYVYEVENEEKGREHAHAIAQAGYRRVNDNGELEVFPVHRIVKVKVVGGDFDSNYLDEVEGT